LIGYQPALDQIIDAYGESRPALQEILEKRVR
jgi:hypothetical protein